MASKVYTDNPDLDERKDERTTQRLTASKVEISRHGTFLKKGLRMLKALRLKDKNIAMQRCRTVNS